MRGVHFVIFDQHVQFDVEGTVVFVPQVLKRLGILGFQFQSKMFQSFLGHYPGRHHSDEVFRSEGTQRNIFPGLKVSCRHIVHQAVPENMIPGLIYFHWFAQLIASSNHGDHLQLEVHFGGFAEGRLFGGRNWGFLARRSRESVGRNNDGR